jgi:hypothetical protein
MAAKVVFRGAGFKPVGFGLAWTKTHRLEACATRNRYGLAILSMVAMWN